MSAPASAPTLAACATISGSWGFLTFSPRGYIIATSGTLHSSHLSDTIPSFCSISGSSFAPMLMCSDTASAPSLIAPSTLPISIFLFGAGPSDVLPEKCAIRPMSGDLGMVLIIPLLTSTHVSPAEAHW